MRQTLQNFGKTKKQYTAQGSTSDIVVRAIMAVIFGYFGVAFATEINFGAIIWNTLQVIMYICSGVMQMHNSYVWVVNDYRYAKIRKIDLLDKFRIYAEQMRLSGEMLKPIPTSANADTSTQGTPYGCLCTREADGAGEAVGAIHESTALEEKESIENGYNEQ